MKIKLNDLRSMISEILMIESRITPSNSEIKQGKIYLALINNVWTPVKVIGYKTGLDDNGNPDNDRILFKLRTVKTANKVKQTRPAMSLRKISSDLNGKEGKFGSDYTPVHN